MAKSSSRKTARNKTASKKTARKAKRAPPPRSRKLSPRKSVRSSAPRAAEKVPKAAKWVYAFGGGKAAGRADMRNLLGGKGAGLAEMANLGLPVPPGFTITTEVCTYYYQNGKTYPADLEEQVNSALARLGRSLGRKFGDPENPLL